MEGDEKKGLNPLVKKLRYMEKTISFDRSGCDSVVDILIHNNTQARATFLRC